MQAARPIGLTPGGRVFMMHAFESQIWKELPAIEEKESNIIDSSLKKNLLCFTPRLQSALKENGIDNMNRLAETPFAELKKMHGIGRGSINHTGLTLIDFKRFRQRLIDIDVKHAQAA